MDFYRFGCQISTGLAPALLTPARSESVVRIGLTDRPPGSGLDPYFAHGFKKKQGAEGKGFEEGKNSHTALLFSRLPHA